MNREKNLINKNDLAQKIDHTLLKQDATQEQITLLCEQALEHQFCSVCVNSFWVSYAYSLLKNSAVKVCTVVGFPLGASSSEAKAFEAQKAIADGASEIDMVINIGLLKGSQYDTFLHDISGVRNVCTNQILKVILETCLLTDEQKIIACQIAQKAQADFVKTSTGFSTGGATVSDIALMRKTVGSDMGVKASGGVRSFNDAMAMINAGSTRLGTSAGVAILSGEISPQSY
ncbi:MAG: deoxyribose-phosphate aldolase [Treponemataceae bacterium]